MPDSEAFKTSDIAKPDQRSDASQGRSSTASSQDCAVTADIVSQTTLNTASNADSGEGLNADANPKTDADPKTSPISVVHPEKSHTTFWKWRDSWRLQGIVGAIAFSIFPLLFLGIVTLKRLPYAQHDVANSTTASVIDGTGLGFPPLFGLLWFATTVVTVSGVGLFMHYWSGQMLKVIEETTEMVRSLHQGNWAVSAPQSDMRELDPLADSLDQLTRQLRKLCKERDQQNQVLQQMTDELEDRIHQRTAQLHKIISQLKQEILERKQAEGQLQRSQAKLIHSEKMSGLGQMVAGIAHEINNPVNFIHGNLKHVQHHVQDILVLLDMYETLYPDPPPKLKAIAQDIDIDFLQKDLRKIVASMQIGTDRILGIVRSLRTFSRVDQVEFKHADIHEGIDSTLLILKHRLKACPGRPQILVVKQYAPDLPLVECHAGQINQVFMNILSNALDALDESGELCVQKSEPPMLIISTQTLGKDRVTIQISDNGPGIPTAAQARLFDPFFTTKPVGKGTGLGMSISYTIVAETHGGKLRLRSSSGQGASFVIELPINQNPR